MDNKTVFEQTQSSQNEQPQPVPAEQVYTPESTPSPQESKAPSAPPPPILGRFPGILKILLSIGALVIVGFLIITFVFPLFSRKNSGPVTLTYWGLWEDPAVMKVLIAEFERKNPTISVTYAKQDIKQYRERLQTRIQNGNGPDIFRFHNTWVSMLSDSLLPLPKEVMTPTEFKNAYYPVIQADIMKKGAIYGVPLGLDMLAMYVNTQLFNAAGLAVPQTWDDFDKVARRLTVKDESGQIKTSGAAMGTVDNITHSYDIISLLLLQNGVNVHDISSTAQNASEALQFYTKYAKGEDSVWSTTLDPSLLMFSRGELAMYFGYSWDYFTIKATNPNIAFAVYPVPSLPDRQMTVASYWVEGVSLKTKHQKEALLFMKYLAQKETAQKLYTESSKTRAFGEPYARKDLAETLQSNQLIAPFVTQAPFAVSSFFASDTYDSGVNEKMNAYLGNAVRSILDTTSPDTAVETLSKGVAQVSSQYGQ